MAVGNVSALARWGESPDTEAEGGIPPAEYCPVSIGAKLLGDRWTLLIVRELMVGAEGFNEIRRGLPGISQTLLADRLRYLARIGIIDRSAPAVRGTKSRYTLTQAGRGLRPVIEALGMWTIDWHFPAPQEEDCDPALLIWRVFQALDRSKVPDRLCIEFRFPDTDPSRGWIGLDSRRSNVCVGAPEWDPDLIVTTSPRTLSEVRFGYRDMRKAITSGLMSIDGSPTHVREFPNWLRLSPFAADIHASRALD